MTTKPAFIKRDFNDAGTAQSFTARAVVPAMPIGQFGNYEAAGIVREATDEELQAATAAPVDPVVPDPKGSKGGKATS